MRRLAALCAAVAAVLVTASIAEAQFASSASSGPMALSSRTLDAPAALAATANCVKNVSVSISLTWSASSLATGYTIMRVAAAGSTQVGSVGGGTTSFTDSSVAFSTAYTYYVVATYNAWTADSSTASATTLSKSCK